MQPSPISGKVTRFTLLVSLSLCDYCHFLILFFLLVLLEVVYSEQLTSVQGSPPDIDIPKGGTQKLPYYALVDRMYNEQHERIKVLNEKLETVTERFHFVC